MFYTSQQLAQALVELTKEKGANTRQVIKGFIVFCQQRNLSHLLPRVLAHLEKINYQKKEDGRLIIETAVNLSGDTLDKIRKYVGLESRVRINQRVQPGIQGGFRAYYQNKIYDASLKSSLNKLKSQLLR